MDWLLKQKLLFGYSATKNFLVNQIQQYFIFTSYQKEDTLNAFIKQEEQHRPNPNKWYSTFPLTLQQQHNI